MKKIALALTVTAVLTASFLALSTGKSHASPPAAVVMAPQDSCCNFKFVKEFTTDDIEQRLLLPYSVWGQCSPPPHGRKPDNEHRSNLLDIHVEVWYRPAGFGTTWTLLTNGGLVGSADYKCTIDQITGDIEVDTYNNSGDYRIVVLA